MPDPVRSDISLSLKIRKISQIMNGTTESRISPESRHLFLNSSYINISPIKNIVVSLAKVASASALICAISSLCLFFSHRYKNSVINNKLKGSVSENRMPTSAAGLNAMVRTCTLSRLLILSTSASAPQTDAMLIIRMMCGSQASLPNERIYARNGSKMRWLR